MSIDTDSLQFKSVTYAGLAAGPRLVVTGAVHGNETCGPRAILRVIEDLDAKRLVIAAGTATFVPVANPLAYAKGERAGDRNLNRNLAPTDNPADFEDHVANWLCPLLARHDVLLDLHSTQARNGAFCMLGPRDNDGPLQPFRQEARERALALRLGVRRFVDGWLETYAKGVERRVQRIGSPASRAEVLNTDPRYGVGTTEYMRTQGGCALTLECGQHDDPDSPEVGYRAIVNALAHLGLTRGGAPVPVEDFEYLSLTEVTDRLHADDAFSQNWRGFDRVARGNLIGTRHDGTRIEAEFDGFILFPNPKSLPGNEWFYLARSRPPGELAPLY
jgi:predicted deacylase